MNDLSLPPVYFLLVDDLEDNLLVLEGLLRRPGLDLLRAQSGTAALEILLKYDVALALIDVQMPGMNGFELAELMRGSERTRRVPIIFLTATGMDWQRSFRGYEAGGVDFLQKPIEPDILRSKAAVFFELYRQRQEVARQRDDLKVATERISQLLEESQKQSTALKEADQRKNEFLAMLAHELRNPLAPIRTGAELLGLLPIKDAELDRIRAIISRQVNHMVRLINDLLDIARIVRGKIEIQRGLCDLRELVLQTVTDYRSTLEEKGLKLNVEVQERPLLVDGDSVRLAQVIGNLLHNASKFTPSGKEVTVRAAYDEPTHQVTVSVIDQGIGMEPELLSRVFEPFYQASQQLDRHSGGLGLGLALAQGIIKHHKGTIVATSGGRDQGSTLTIYLPVCDHRRSSKTDSFQFNEYPRSST